MSVPPPASQPPKFGSFAPYRQALKAISARTGSPLPSLVFSFAVLHELTALAPLVGFFFGARALGVGERVVNAIQGDTTSPDTQGGWIREKGKEWVAEGSVWAEKVGRRYGVFGYEKRTKEGTSSAPPPTKGNTDAPSTHISTRALAGDAANAIVAYGITKV